MNKNYINLAFLSTLLFALISDMGNSISHIKNKSMNAHLRFCRLEFRSMISVILTAFLSITLLLSLATGAHAAANAYSLDWNAADPAVNNAPYMPTYAKLTPTSLACPGTDGRYADPLTDAVAYGPTSLDFDAVPSLAPQDLVLGQIVPFEMVINVNGDTTPENGTINFTTSFATETTGGCNFGYDPAYTIYCAFVDTADAGTIDPGNDATVDSFNSTLLGDSFQGTFNVSGLDNGDQVVVEIWVVLNSTIPSQCTGTVQTALESAQTVTGDTINTGQQTVPLLRVQDFAENPVLEINKTALPENYSAVGQNITYTYNVTNSGNVNITGPINVTDNIIGTITISNNSLAPGHSVIGTANYTIIQDDLDNGSVTNEAFATGRFGNNTVTSNTANATVTANQNPALLIVKLATPSIYSVVGQHITYTYIVTNSGNVGIAGPINVTDNKTGTFTISASGPAPGYSVVGTANYTITQADLETCNDNATPINDSDDSDHSDHSNDNATPEVPLESSTDLDNSANLYGCDHSDDCDDSDHSDHSNDNATPICSVTNTAFAIGTFGNNTVTSNTAHATVTAIQCPKCPHHPHHPNECPYHSNDSDYPTYNDSSQ